ncbi:CAP domain-containing protein [Thermoactinospora rubra]|uniref:CAP domain-containing protein n=1 Tax=Thermoactinospora rubra TaxID=1088767 RepID=UPI00117F952A|nr:CAP domain-containing protein [Thermoactinospora rubra]
MWQPPHTRHTRRRARRRSRLGLLSCMLTVLFAGVLIGRLTTAEDDSAPQVYLNSTAPPAAAPSATPTTKKPQRAADAIPRERERAPSAGHAPTAGPTPEGQIRGETNPDHTSVYGTPDLTVSPQMAARVVQLTNRERRRHGCGPLRVDARLTRSAEEHSLEMAASGQFGHSSPDGSSPWDRMARAGYSAGAAENIGRGYPTAEAAVQGWMASPDHRKNILNCAIAAIGVGVVPGGGGPWWTQDFGYS